MSSFDQGSPLSPPGYPDAPGEPQQRLAGVSFGAQRVYSSSANGSLSWFGSNPKNLKVSARCGGSAARRFRATQGEAFVFGRTDWQYVLNTFCIGYKIGYHFIRTEHGACSGNFVGIGADSSNVAVQVDVVDPYSSGILITNGEFVSNSGDDSTHVRVAATNPGPVRFSNCAFWGTGDRVALLEGSGNTTFSGCLFRAWDRNSVGRAAIDLLNGALIVSGCQFAGAGTGVHLGPDAQAASVFGNHLAGTEAVAGDSDGAVAIGLNITGR